LAEAGAKDFERCRAAESGGRGVSGRAATGRQKIRRHRAIQLQLLAPGRSGPFLLHGSARPLQLRGGRPYSTGQTLQMMFDLGYVKPEEVARIAKNSGRRGLRSARRSFICAGRGVIRLQAGSLPSLGCIGNRVYTGSAKKSCTSFCAAGISRL